MMPNLQDFVAATSSISLRIAAYGFLRWIPGPFFPPIIYTLFAIYSPSFLISFLTQAQYNIIEDDVLVTVTESEVEDQPPNYSSTAAHSHNLPKQDKPTHVEEDINVEETIILEKRSPKFWRTLLTGLPSPTSSLLSLVTLLINIGLVLAVTDLLYRGKTFYPSNDLSFIRLGYVSSTEAKLLIREPDQSKMPITVQIRNANPQPPSDLVLGWHTVGGVNILSNDTDYTAVLSVPLRGLYQTEYEIVTSNNHSVSFSSPPRADLPSRKSDGKFTFLTSSCIIPHFPYDPTDHPLSIPGFRHLAQNLPSLGAQFMLFLGDFIYIDVPKRFGSDVESYRREYRQIYASPDWPSVGQNLSWIHVLDDHEIANDYCQGCETSLYKNAVEPWRHYQTAANPPQARGTLKINEIRDDVTYFEFSQGGADFFMMDTRRYRDRNSELPANSTEKTMLGKQQLTDLLAFLARPVTKGVRWKIIASSIPFTKNWGGPSALDTWAGFLNERQQILEAMWDVGLIGGVGVVVLSGDRHEFAATAFPPPQGGKWPISATVNEFSTSPLSQFYLPIPTYRQTDEEDVLVKYIPTGNSKFGAVTIESPSVSEQSIFKFRLFIDGEEAWSSVLLSPPAVKGSRWSKDALWG